MGLQHAPQPGAVEEAVLAGEDAPEDGEEVAGVDIGAADAPPGLGQALQAREGGVGGEGHGVDGPGGGADEEVRLEPPFQQRPHRAHLERAPVAASAQHPRPSHRIRLA
jgi:hypothetical protein